MAINGNIGSIEYDDLGVLGSGHPPVVRSGLANPTSGEWPAGLLLARDGTSKKLIEHDPGTTTFLGVLTEAVDLAQTSSVNYCPHGSVRQDALKVGATTPTAPDAATLSEIEEAGVWPE